MDIFESYFVNLAEFVMKCLFKMEFLDEYEQIKLAQVYYRLIHGGILKKISSKNWLI